MNKEVDYDTSYYTTVNVNLRLHPELSPKDKIVAIEIGAIQGIPIEEQEHSDECLSALTGILLEEIPTIISNLVEHNIIHIETLDNKRFLFLQDGVRC